MADAVTTKVLLNSPTHYVVYLTNVSDGTGESAVTKVDKSALLDSSATAVEPDSLELERIVWACQGFTYIRLYWDHTTAETIFLVPGNDWGEIDFASAEKSYGANRGIVGITDGRGAGGTGDVLLTTVGHSSGDTYCILLVLRKAAV